jgi:hypothetical protein
MTVKEIVELCWVDAEKAPKAPQKADYEELEAFIKSHKFTMFTQGSAAEPYKMELLLNPLSISCTCQAGISGIPCKHRKHILQGHVYTILEPTPAIKTAVEMAAKIWESSDMPGYMEEYEKARDAIKAQKEKSEKAFKKYRDSVIDYVLKRGTEKAKNKASAALDEVIQGCINAEIEAYGLFEAIKTVFVRP